MKNLINKLIEKLKVNNEKLLYNINCTPSVESIGKKCPSVPNLCSPTEEESNEKQLKKLFAFLNLTDIPDSSYKVSEMSGKKTAF